MIDVRLARPKDAEAIADISAATLSTHAKALPTEFRKPRGKQTLQWALRLWLMPRGKFIYVAVDDERLAGFVFVRQARHPGTSYTLASRSLYINEIGVAADQRRKGVGSALLKAVRETARDWKINHIELDTWAFNEGAQKFFLSQGFAPKRIRMWTG